MLHNETLGISPYIPIALLAANLILAMLSPGYQCIAASAQLAFLAMPELLIPPHLCTLPTPGHTASQL